MVGEGGMSPTYFHHYLTFYEVQDFIKGLKQRYIPQYECARMIHAIVGSLFAKDYKLPEFPWDSKFSKENTEYTKEEIEEMKRAAESFEKQLNGATR